VESAGKIREKEGRGYGYERLKEGNKGVTYNRNKLLSVEFQLAFWINNLIL
jgi:hypothetical protein